MNEQKKTRIMTIPSVRAGRSLGFLPHAHLCDAGVVRKTFLGLTMKHAARRARRNVDGPLQVQIGMA